MISAVMSKFQLVGFSTQSDASELMSQADTEDGLPSHEAADVIYRVGAGLGIAWAVREEHAVRFQCEHIFCWSLRRNNRYLAALAAQLAQDVLFDSVIVGYDVKALRLIFHANHSYRLVRAFAHLPHVRMFGSDDLGQVGSIHLWNRERFGDERVGVSFQSGDHTTHYTVIAQMAYQGAGIDVPENRYFELLQVLFCDLLGAPVGAHARKLADNQAFDIRARSFVVFGVGA